MFRPDQSGYEKALTQSGLQSKRTIILHGELGEKFGKTHEIAAHRGSEIIRHLVSFYSDFAPYFAERQWEMKIGERAVDYEMELRFPLNANTVEIFPVVAGGKTKGLGKILTGMLIIGLTIATAGGFAAFGSAFAAGFGGTAVAGASGIAGGIAASTAAVGAAGIMIPFLGVSLSTIGLMFGSAMILGGLAQALAPKVENDDPSARGPESFIFNEVTNTTGEGNPVPLCFGKFLTGSHVIHGSIRNSNIRSFSHDPNFPEGQPGFNANDWVLR